MSGTTASAVEVVIRTRPTLYPAKEIAAKSDQTVAISLGRQGKGVEGGVNNQNTAWEFKFDSLLADATQEQVYDTAAKDIVESVLNGYNGTVMAYGQTGAGKTYTISGDKLSYENRGVIPRAIGHIFRAINDRPDLAFRVSVSYVEIYNEHLYDLLAVRPPASTRNPSVAHNIDLAIQEDVASGAISIKGLNKKEITSEQECLDALFHGDTTRAIGEHALNEQSTRSHTIYTIYLETRSRVESSEKVLVSKLNLIDLAGSERVGKTQSSGIVLTEAKFINKSLSFLEQVVVALSNKNRDHIPFRQSKLTQLLKDSLGGNTKTRVICNIQIDKPNLEETISTLKFGTRMKKITNRISVNIALDPFLHVSKLQKEIRELKHELNMHDIIANRLGVKYEAYTPEESSALRKRIEKYIGGGPVAEEIEIENLRQVREAFRIFKAIVLETVAKAGTQSKASTQLLPGRGSPSPSDLAQEESHMVGEIDEDASGGFGLGLVAPERRPMSRPDSRDEPLKPKNILRTRARQAGQNIAQAVSNIPQPGSSSSMSTHIRGGSASRRAAAMASPTSALPPVSSAGNASAFQRAQSSPKAGRRASFGSGLNEEKTASQQTAAVNLVRQSTVNGVSRGPPPTNEPQAYEEFRTTQQGFDLSELLSAARNDSIERKKDLRQASLRVNDTKKRIDSLSALIAEKKSQRQSRGETLGDIDSTVAGEVEILDEEEYSALQELQQAKGEYKSFYQQRSEIEQDVRAAEEQVQQARLDLFSAFAEYYREQYGTEPSTNSDYSSPSQQARLLAQQLEDRQAAAYKQQQYDQSLDPEARSFLQATRTFQQTKTRPIINGGRRPYVGAAFK